MKVLLFAFFFFVVVVRLFVFRATPVAHGSSQARGKIRAAATNLQILSTSNTNLHLSTSNTTEQGQGLNQHLHGY